MEDILKIIFSIFNFSSEYSLNKDSKKTLTKKQKKITFVIAVLCLLIPIIILLLVKYFF